MWTIDKQFNFCYGHRVWSQELKAEYCEKGDASCKCKHLHGHEATVHVFLEAPELERGMVTDFKHLGWLKDFLDTYLDHKFIMDVHDPIYHWMIEEHYCSTEKPYRLTESVLLDGHVAGQHIIPEPCLGSVSHTYANSMIEVFGGIFLVDFVPTSENLSQWLFKLVQAKMKPLGVKVSRVDWFETPKSRSTYSE